jgi:hypothetical protein
MVRGRFDEIRLTAGDYLIFFKVAGGGACSGAGSYPLSNVGLFLDDTVPEKPLLDELVTRQNHWKLGVAQWRFMAS